MSWCIGITVSLLWGLHVGGGAASATVQPTQSLCGALGQVGTGDRIEVSLSGIFEVSYETEVFYDPGQRVCAVDVEPATAVVLPPDLVGGDFSRLLERDHRAYVTFEGILQGPKMVGQDDPSLPIMLSYMNRSAGRRYGHMGSFRTQLVVKRVLASTPVSKGAPRYGEWAMPRSRAPELRGAELPTYPETAQRAGIEGVVQAEVRVENGRVMASEILLGDRLLGQAVLANIGTWRFDPTVNARFNTTFVFELERRLTGADQNPRIELHLPEYVRVVGAENGW